LVSTGEHKFLSQLRRRAGPRTAGLRLGMGDDCAILRPQRSSEVVVTTDLMLEGVHFRRDWHTAEQVGHRCLARGLSDLAAMGARPLAAFLSLAVSHADLAGRPSWADRFLDGLLALAGAHKVPLAGGDLAEAPAALVVADIVLTGTVPAGRALLRSGARRGDAVYVTGSLGGAAAELAALQRGDRAPANVPQPRVVVGEALVRRGLASACIDLSDGLSTDLNHLCEESGVAAEIDAAALPIHRLAQESVDAMELALHGGEDYELLFTAPEKVRVPRSIAGVPIRRIGDITSVRKGGPRVSVLIDGKTQALEAGGWEHFGKR
jgi:thiamine-monophosphate kinase